MVRDYKRKKEVKWTEEDMKKAVEHVALHHNISAAARLFNVPKSTLHDRLSLRIKPGSKVGHPTALTIEEEAEIAETCIIFAEWGFGLGRKEVESVINEYLRAMKKPNPFKDGVPGEGWWSSFLKRHPEIVHRRPQHLQMVRARASSQEVISHWFTECLGPTLDKLQLREKPERIFNVNESGFPLSWTPKLILTKCGHKAPQALIPGSGREQITVQTCISASGQLMPPYVIYKGARVSPFNTFGGPLGTRYGATENGWMTGEIFLDWLRMIFLSSIPSSRPVLLLLDGHRSHIGYDVRKVAVDHGIHVLKLLPHTTHILQPLDVGVLNQFKHVWEPIVGHFTCRERRIIKKSDFPGLLKQLWSHFKPEWAVAGFRLAGVVPLNKDAIADSAYKPSEPFSASTDDNVVSAEVGDRGENMESGGEEENAESGGEEVNFKSGGEEESVESERLEVEEENVESEHEEGDCMNGELLNNLLEEPDDNEFLVRPSVEEVFVLPQSLQCTPVQISLSDDLPATPAPTLQYTTSAATAQTPTTTVATTQSPVSAANTSSPMLRDFFASLLQRQTPSRPQSAKRRRLTAVGESLTEEEAMERIRKDEEEKIRKEEKAKRAEICRRKREDKQTKKKQKEWFCPQCLKQYDKRSLWIECDSCQLWYHAQCTEYKGWSTQDLSTETFVCPICVVEKENLLNEE